MKFSKIKGFKWFGFELTGSEVTYEMTVVTLDAFSKLSFDEKENQSFYYFQEEWKPINWRDLRELLLLNL